VVTFIIRRLLISIPLLILSSILVFILVTNAGDPLENLRTRPNVSKQQIQNRISQLHLNESLPQRYWTWVSNFVRGNFGTDNSGSPVKPQLFRAMGYTLRLVVVALIVALVVGVLIGVISALRQYTIFDYVSTTLAFLFFAMPIFWFAILLKEFGAIKLNNLLQKFGWSRWVATIGPQSPILSHSFWGRMSDYAAHMILPVIALAAISFAEYSRYVRASMLDTMTMDYVRTARSKGISEKRVVARHAFRNALIPLTTIVALNFAAVLGGAIITETVFQWNGMGKLFIQSIQRIDPNMAMAWLMVTAILVVVFNIIADVAYAYLDPRIRLD
jgi:peptide/nickel transport system permease protein